MSNEGSEIPPAELEYFEKHASDTLVPNMIACAVITAFFSTLFVILRLLGRRLTRGPFRVHISDWLLLVAWVRAFHGDKSMRVLSWTPPARYSSSFSSAPLR
jgi:hypothetical protein